MRIRIFTVMCLSSILSVFCFVGCNYLLQDVPIPGEEGLRIDLTACADDIDCCWELVKDNIHLAPVTDSEGDLLPDDEVNFFTFSTWVFREVSGL